MDESELRTAQIAAAAALLVGPERDKFLKQRCGGDSVLTSRVMAIIGELEAADRQSSELMLRVDPLATIDWIDGRARQDAYEASMPETRSRPPFTATIDPASHHELSLTQDYLPPAVKNGGSITEDPLDDAVLNRTLSPDEQSNLDLVCARFMDAWKHGSEPNLQQFIPPDGDIDYRNRLVFPLVILDLEQRHARNRPMSAQQYLSQAPDCHKAIRSALTRRDRTSLRDHQGAKPTVVRGRSGTRGNDDEFQSMGTSGSSPIRYQPIKIHARGGLGAVYRAKDMELRRTVALKRILPAHEDNLNSRARFVFEAEVTGSLEHPGIVPVYGLGTYGDGQPYYAMRFIRGESLTHAIRRFHRGNEALLGGTIPQTTKADTGKRSVNHKRDRKEVKPALGRDFYGREFRLLLRRLIDTCNAMHYAHERGVLHRDLKPDNVMLGQYGETLIVDWGLAKLMSRTALQPKDDALADQRAEPLTVPDAAMRTSIGHAIGTPMYMSSEQALGLHDELSPASDVYSLGAMLFNMISGEHPIAGKSTLDIIRNVRNGVTRSLLDVMPTAPKPLVSICRKAMRKDPSTRYQTAAELAEDIDRWLSDEQVLAHADAESVAEKAGRLIRRYRGWTVSTAVALLAVTVVAIIASLLIHRAKQNEEIAKIRATHFKSQAVQRYHDSRAAIDTWLVQSNDALQFFPGTYAVRQKLLTAAAEDYAKLSATASEDPELELERGRTMIRLGDLSQLREDMPHAIEHYKAAIEVLENPPPGTSSGELAKDDIAWMYQAEVANATARKAIALANQGKLLEADQSYSLAIEKLIFVDAQTYDPNVVRYLAAALVNHGELLSSQNRFEEAQQRFTDGIATLDRLAALQVPKDVMSIARAEELFGRMLRQQAKYDLALERFDSAVARLLPLVKKVPDDPEYLDALASTYISAASIYQAIGRAGDEKKALQSSVEHYRSLVRALPDLPRYSENLAASLTDLALLLYERDRGLDAKPLLDEADAIVRDLIRRYGVPRDYASLLAANQDALGQVLMSLGDTDLAKQLFTQSLQTYMALREQSPEIADYDARMAIVQSHLAQTTEEAAAHAEFESAAQLLAGLLGEFPEVSRYASSLGHVYYQHGLKLQVSENASAAEMFKKARDTWIAMGDERDANTNERLAWLLATCPVAAVRDRVAANTYANQALAADAENRHFRSTLAMVHMMTGDLTAAREVMEIVKVDDQDRDGRELLILAAIEAKTGDVERAKALQDGGYQWMRDQAPMSHDLRFLLGELTPSSN